MGRTRQQKDAPEAVQPAPVTPEAEAPAPETGTGRVLINGTISLPAPRVEAPSKPAPAKAAAKKADPNKPRDVEVGSAHIIATIAATGEQNRMTRLTELARTDNDVKWLLQQYNESNNPKSE